MVYFFVMLLGLNFFAGILLAMALAWFSAR